MSIYVGLKCGKIHTRTETSEYYCKGCGYPVTDHDSYCRECGNAFQESFATEQTCEWIWGEEWIESSSQGPRELQWANWYLNCGCWDGSEKEFENLDDPYEKPYTYWQYCPYCGKKVKWNEEQSKKEPSSKVIEIYKELLKGLEENDEWLL